MEKSLGESLVVLIVSTLLMCIITPIVMIVAFPFTALHAYVCMDLWTMFILPLTGVATPSFWHMCGVLLFVAVAKGIKTEKAKKEEEKKKDLSDHMADIVTPLFTQVVITLIAWGMGHFYLYMAS